MTFRCAWLQDPQVPEWVKPERVGAVVIIGKGRRWLTVVPAGKEVSDELKDWASAYAKKNNFEFIGDS